MNCTEDQLRAQGGPKLDPLTFRAKLLYIHCSQWVYFQSFSLMENIELNFVKQEASSIASMGLQFISLILNP